jgi:signal transduction histidine kinase/CheY-like chemotaxis protein
MALVPLLLVELALVALYVAGTLVAGERTGQTAEALAEQGLRDATSRQVDAISARLTGLGRLAQVFAGQVRVALATPTPPDPAERARWGTTPEGAWVTTRGGPGQAAMFYSGVKPIGEAELQKADRLARTDALMVDLQAADPMVQQVYFNSHDSLNRIYPYFDTASQFPPRMDIPSYNFYYEADLAHNPTRGVAWTDAYLDPAGAGWIVSALAPVYADGAAAGGDDRLDGVVGLDITLAAIVDQVLNLSTPWGGYAVLVDGGGTALALPPAAEAAWGLKDLRAHAYAQAVTQDTLKPEDYRLMSLQPLHGLAAQMAAAPRGVARVDLGGPQLAAWDTVGPTGWRLLLVVPEAAVYGPAEALRADGLRTAAWMVAGMVAFYALFFAVMARRAAHHARALSEPLRGIERMAASIAAGDRPEPPAPEGISELDATVTHIAELGDQLRARDRERAAHEVELSEAVAAERKANRARADFLATMSHEIRTPMHGILGMAELLHDGPLTEVQRAQLGLLQSSGRNLLAVLDDILDLSRVEAGRLELRPAPTDLRALCAEVVGLLVPLADRKGLRLQLDWPAGLPAWRAADPVRVRQILLNLVGNALKFTEAGGVTLRAAGDGPALRLTVEDSGPGVPEALRERIFEPFTQADTGAGRQHGGTGLGLAISRRLARAMGGELRLDCPPAGGAAFTFAALLPEAPAPAPPAAPAAPPAPPAPARVLLVEDNPVNQAYVRALLRKAGHPVDVAADAEAALELLRKGPYGLGLFDLHLPGMDGIALLRALRSLDADGRPRTPVLVATADVLPEDQAAALAAGAEGVLHKPFDAAGLLAAVARAIGPPPARPS